MKNCKLTLTKYHHLMQMKRCQVFYFTRKTIENEEFVTTTSNDHIKAILNQSIIFIEF